MSPLSSYAQVEKVEAELGLEQRFRVSAQAFVGTYRGYRVKVVSEPADEAGGGGGTHYTVYLDERVVGPPGFRRLRFPATLRRHDTEAKIGPIKFVADDPVQLTQWLTRERRNWLEHSAFSRDFSRFRTTGGRVRTAADIRKGLDKVLLRLEKLRYDWPFAMPDEIEERIPTLRVYLTEVSDPLARHDIFTQLEKDLYRLRDRRPGALDEYDDVTDQHHDELLSVMRDALLARHGSVPVIDTYRQASIRQQKARNWREALRWAERGLAVYADQARDPAAVDDLRTRATRLRNKL